jgi:hypothetical protein
MLTLHRNAMASRRRQAVLDGSLWDGSDFLNAHIESFATRRFVDFLLSIHAAPFIAEPAWVWVDKMTKEQLARLEPAERHPGCRGTLSTGVSILQPRAAYCLRAWRLVGTANVCPHCGQGCIVCDVCGAMHTRCESCGREITCSADTPAEKRNGRVVYRHDWMTANCVIDGSRWGGEDLLCGWGLLIASRRIVDLLISLDAQGFSAEPIPVWVDNMTKDQLARLEEAKRPVKG